MLSYRHIFHAGNFADVHKHLVLTLVMTALQRKPAALCYLETHAGAGCYDLHTPQARKNSEYALGIDRLLTCPDPPAAVATYLQLIASCRPATASADAKPRYYPGSPWLARAMLRPQDRMVACELHPTDIGQLKALFQGDRQVAIHHQDGYLALKAFLPPREKRGLVLIDPPYELKDELRRVADQLTSAVRRWATGCYLLWYPLVDGYPIASLRDQVATSGIRKILCCELRVSTQPSERMTGSGLLIVNPPWQLENELQALLPWLARQLAQDGPGAWRVDWLVPE